MTLKIKELNLTKLEVDDIPRLIELSASVGWDYDTDEIKTIMSSGRIYGHKNEDGNIVSSAAIVEYDSKFAWIGMVIVNGENRGLGLGRIVTQKCIDSVSNNVTTMLIATEAGKPMYEKMGFVSRDCIHKFLCDQYVFKETINDSNCSIIPMDKNDLTTVLKIDKDAFGVDRKNLLINRMKQSQASIVAKNPDGEIIGYGLSILGPVNLVLGPIVAKNPETAILIVDHFIKNYQGKFRIDVPSGNKKFMSYLKDRGFVQVSQPPVMVNNSMQLPSRNKTYFGIVAQAIG